ncbi:hypothetical protein B6D52_00895 [Candidatus Parcubacteria bacterium 4484_255]|nr:MAG: hypothetical protein B6D52_00895 [Candidatus Parcubacteria bacterium 4484_255]
MCKKILYILGYWIYFIGEGCTEAMTWMSIKDADVYHVWRVVENFGLILLILLLIFSKAIKKTWNTFWVSIFATISGLGLYEFAFSQYKYGTWRYQKTSRWFGISHPSYNFWLIVIIISIIMIIYLFHKDAGRQNFKQEKHLFK